MSIRGTAGPIRSISKLCSAIGLEEKFLREIADLPPEKKYQRKMAPSKKDGSPRIVYSPSKEVRLAQQRIANRFFKNPRVIKWPEHLYGGIPKSAINPPENRDHVSCASRHRGAKSVASLDIESFFDNISKDIVEEILTKQMGWSESPAKLVSEICTLNGHLPQGGITSSYFALLSLCDFEIKLTRSISHKGLTYTRYVDDITISSKISNFNFTPVTNRIEQKLIEKGLSLNKSKTNIRKSGLEALVVHGINIEHNKISLPKEEVGRIRRISKQTTDDARESGRRSLGYRKRFWRSIGLANKLARVKSSHHKNIISKLRSIQPLPSFVDYEVATNVCHTLRDLYEEKKQTHWYWKKFNSTMARLDIISREDSKWAKNLRTYMKHYRPEFKKQR